MASRQEGGGRDFFLALGGSTRSPFSRRGLAFVFFVLFDVCVLCFDNLMCVAGSVFLFVCLYVFLSVLSFVRLQDPGCCSGS